MVLIGLLATFSAAADLALMSFLLADGGEVRRRRDYMMG